MRCRYWLQAGRQAVASSATVEAESHLRQGLDAIAALPESPDRDRQELALLSTLGVALTIQKGWAAPEVADAYARAQVLSERVGPNPQLFWVLWGMWAFYLVKGDQNKGLEFAQRMMRIATGETDAALVLEANFALGLSHYYMGDLAAAREHVEAVVAGYVPERHHPNAFLTSQDVGVTARSVAAMVLWLRGETELGLARSRDAIELASELKHPFSKAYALGCAAWLDAYRRAPEPMAAHATATIELSTAQALGFWLVWGMIFAGRAVFDAGQTAAGAKHMEEALATYRGIGSGMVVPYFLALLAEVESANGDATSALSRLDDARRLIAEGGEAFMAAEIDRLEGEIRRKRAAPADRDEAAAVERLFERALDVAQRQGNRVFALRAATSLAEALAARGAGGEAPRRSPTQSRPFRIRRRRPTLRAPTAVLQSLARDHDRDRLTSFCPGKEMGRELWTDAYLNSMRDEMDPAADRVVDAIYASSSVDGVNRLLMHMVRNTNPPPAEVQAMVDGYFAATAVLPEWADPKKIAIAEDLFSRHGMLGTTILCCASLPECYLDALDVPVLASTTQLQRHVYRRIFETSHMVITVMQPGGMTPARRRSEREEAANDRR